MGNRIDNPRIVELFKAIARQHSLIQHEEGGDAGIIRFFRFNADELSAMSRSAMNNNKLILGLGSYQQPGTTWQYRDGGTATQKIKGFDVVVLGAYEGGSNYDLEEGICSQAEQVCDDIQSWLYMTANSANAQNWPVVDLIDLTTIACKRLSSYDVGEWCGAVMRITLRDNHNYKANTNPLNGMMP